MIRKALLIVFGVQVLGLFEEAHGQDLIHCMSCVDMPDPFSCRTTVRCSPGNRCFTEEVVTSGGLVLYNQGCKSIERCAARKRELEVEARQASGTKTDITTCLNCCDGDYCNIDGCGHTSAAMTERGPLCFSCTAQDSPDTCRDVQACSNTEVCMLKNVQPSGAIFTSGCIESNQCNEVHNVTKRAVVETCPICCETDFCNNDCKHNSSLVRTTTEPTAVTTNPPPATTNTAVAPTTKPPVPVTTAPYSQTMTSAVLQTTQPSSTSGLKGCMSCLDMPDPFACRTTTICSSYEQCYTELIVSSGGLILYNQGCMSKQKCAAQKRDIALRQTSGIKTDITTCLECCEGEFCNIEGCGFNAPAPSTRGPLCFSCAAQDEPGTCRDIAECSSTESCVLKQIGAGSDEFISGCIHRPQCEALQNISGRKRDIVETCPVCCHTDFCNNDCTHNVTATTTTIRVSTTTVATAPPTTPAPATTTKAPVTTQTPSTTSTTKAPAPTTTTKAPVTTTRAPITTTKEPPTTASTTRASPPTTTAPTTTKATIITTTVAPVVTTAPYGLTSPPGFIRCMHCSDMPDPFACRTTVRCSLEDRCYIETVISSGGLTLYNQGCMSTQRCDASKRDVEDRQINTDITTCLECCDGEFCNIDGCGHTRPALTERGPLCFSCAAQQAPDTCRIVKECTSTEILKMDIAEIIPVCLLKKVSASSTEYTSYCDHKTQCDEVQNITRRDVVKNCPVCCNTDFCNNDCTHNSSHVATTTLKPVVTSVITSPPVTSTATSTQAPVTTTVAPPATTVTTTSAPVTTVTTTQAPAATTAQTLPPVTTGPYMQTTAHSHHSTHVHSECTSATDVCFVLDSSGSEGAINFKTMLTFVSDMVKQLPIHGQQHFRICVITFGTRAYTEITFLNVEQNNYDIMNITYRDGETMTSHGIAMATYELNNVNHGARHTANKLMVVVTDGRSTEPGVTQHRTDLAHRQGIQTVAIGVGSNLDQDELRYIASNQHTVYSVEKFLDLVSIEHLLLQTLLGVCKACYAQSDICFVLDSSGSEGSDYFNRQLLFVNSLVQGMAMTGQHPTHICVVSYANDARVDIKLNEFTDKTELMKQIFLLPFRTGESRADSGIDAARFALTGSGQTGARGSANKVMIILTDGHSNNASSVIQAADVARTSGIHMYVIGVGSDVDHNELDLIGSGAGHVWNVSTVNDLKSITQAVFNNAYYVCPNVNHVTSPPTTTTTTTTTPRPTHGSHSGYMSCGGVPTDIMFAIDSTSSEGSHDFHRITHFLHDFAAQFQIDAQHVQFSALTFGNTVHDQFFFNSYTTKSQLLHRINIIPYTQDRSTHIDLALDHLRSEHIALHNGARLPTEARRVVILITDGTASDHAKAVTAAYNLQHIADIVVVGIGSRINVRELNEIASSHRDVLTTPDFTSLHNIMSALTDAVCGAPIPQAS